MCRLQAPDTLHFSNHLIVSNEAIDHAGRLSVEGLGGGAAPATRTPDKTRNTETWPTVGTDDITITSR